MRTRAAAALAVMTLLLLAAGPAARPAAGQTAGQAPAGASPPRPPTFTSGPWAFTLGGRIKLDIIHDFDALESTDSFDPRTIAVDDRAGSNTRIHARETRLSLRMAGPASGRELTLYVETDFYGSGNTLRLRHAYGQYGVLLAGHTYSTFMDEDNVPNTIDFETALAAPLVRQGQLRLTRQLAACSSLAIALEESDPEIWQPSGTTGTTEKTWPDVAVRWRLRHGRGHLQLSGFLGETRLRLSAGGKRDVTIGAVLLSGRVRPGGRDAAYAEVAYGPGLGRYRGGVSAVADAAGHLEAVEAIGLTAGYEHWWAQAWSSNLVVSPVWALDEVGDPALAHDRLLYSAVNLLHWFIRDRAWIGCEYLFGSRRVQSGAQEDANRIQLAVRFNIPG